MNCTQLFLRRAKEHPGRLALWLPHQGETSFEDLVRAASRAQKICRAERLGPGDSVLLIDSLGTGLYAWVTAILASGASVVLVEPWMPVERIERVIRMVQPKAFVTSWLGRLWGIRVPAVRAIPRWIASSSWKKETASSAPSIVEVDAELPGVVTFTSGTTGAPKGVVRTQGYLIEQHRVVSKYLELEKYSRPELSIFANFVLANLSSGRGSLIVPPAWNPSHLRMLDELPDHLRPESLTCGPAFLLALMRNAKVPGLKSVHVGGALTDCWIFEEAFRRWESAHWTHVYGSSEVEPVAVSDAREAVRLSRQEGFFQTLSVGKPVEELRARFDEKTVWVAGPHVCPQYMGNEEENRLFKRRDPDGTVWHCMGDRIREDVHGWWYTGRASQSPEDSALEQKIYSELQSSKSFIHRAPDGSRWLIGDGIRARESEILRNHPEIQGVVEAPIVRDRRHRARIDRGASLMKSRKGRTLR